MKSLDIIDNGVAEKVTIDHFRPRSKYPDDAVTYTNLFGACRTCQDKKGDGEMYTNLLDEEMVNRIRYEHSGRMKSSDSRIEEDISLLELNNEYLRRARGSVLSSFIKCLNGKYGERRITKNEWRQEKERILKNERYTPYIGIVLSYIDKHEKAC